MLVGLAEWVVAVSAVVALGLTAWQLKENARLASENFARQAWAEYLRLGLQNPELGECRAAIKFLKIGSIEDLVSGESIPSQRYLWFLAVLLEAAESLLASFPVDQWRLTVEENLGYHAEALAEIWGAEGPTYSNQLNNLVKKVIETSD